MDSINVILQVIITLITLQGQSVPEAPAVQGGWVFQVRAQWVRAGVLAASAASAAGLLGLTDACAIIYFNGWGWIFIRLQTISGFGYPVLSTGPVRPGSTKGRIWAISIA